MNNRMIGFNNIKESVKGSDLDKRTTYVAVTMPEKHPEEKLNENKSDKDVK